MQQTAVSTMKALIVDHYGPPLEAHIGDVERPKVKDGFLLVRMHAAGVNPFDNKIITGAVKDWVPIKFPYVPGMDAAGVVVEAGSGVENFKEGDAIIGQFPAGAFAEFALISAKDTKLARKPDALDFEQAAAIPEAGLTSLTMLRAANVSEGQSVLVIGASGGLGMFTTQLASAQGARVIATGKAQDIEYLKELGAHDVIDYSQGDTITQMRSRYPDGVDVVIDVVNSGQALLRDAEALHPGGTLVSSLGGPEQSAFPNNVTVHYIQETVKKGDLEDLAQRAADGELHVEIGGTYDLAHAAQALADLEDPAKHTRGKLIIQIA